MVELNEDMFFFPASDGCRLLGFLHRPVRERRRTGIIYCHPFAEEKNCSHVVAVRAARHFARLGYAVLRFDFRGCGDSEGELDEVSLRDWRTDLTAAIDVLRQRGDVESVILWGLRTGAGLALLEAAQRCDVAALLLWQPVLDFGEYMHRFLRQRVGSALAANEAVENVASLRKQLQSGRSVEVFGYPISPRLYADFDETGDAPFRAAPAVRTFMATVSSMDRPPFKLARFAAQHEQDGSIHFEHVGEEPFWDRYWRWDAPATIEATGRWLQTWEFD